MHFQMATLLAELPRIERLELHSFEMNIYLVKVTIGANSGFVYDGTRPLRFSGTQQVRDLFEPFVVSQAVMLHQSYYDEMIGNPPGAGEPLLVPFSMTQPY